MFLANVYVCFSHVFNEFPGNRTNECPIVHSRNVYLWEYPVFHCSCTVNAPWLLHLNLIFTYKPIFSHTGYSGSEYSAGSVPISSLCVRFNSGDGWRSRDTRGRRPAHTGWKKTCFVTSSLKPLVSPVSLRLGDGGRTTSNGRRTERGSDLILHYCCLSIASACNAKIQNCCSLHSLHHSRPPCPSFCPSSPLWIISTAAIRRSIYFLKKSWKRSFFRLTTQPRWPPCVWKRVSFENSPDLSCVSLNVMCPLGCQSGQNSCHDSIIPVLFFPSSLTGLVSAVVAFKPFSPQIPSQLLSCLGRCNFLDL